MKLVAFLLVLAPVAAFAQQPHEKEVQRALIDLDRRSAEFVRGTPAPPLELHVGQPLSPDPEIARQLRPYERMREAQAHELRLPPPVILKKADRPLPLPGRRDGGVDPVTLPRVPD
jgi:hypothetical protein